MTCPQCQSYTGWATRIWRGKDHGYAMAHSACGWTAPKRKTHTEACEALDAELERIDAERTAAQEVPA